MTTTTNWYGALTRKLHLDYHQPHWMRGVAESFTPEMARQQARMFKEAGVQLVEFFTYDHHGFCFFPPQNGASVGKTHPGLAQDYSGAMIEALRAEGIRTMAYINVYGNVHLSHEHPDWYVRDADGQMTAAAWLQYDASHICASSPFIEAYFIPLMQHIITRFDFDAVWLDGGTWLIETLCYCENCKTQFKAATGYDLPTAHPARKLRDGGVLSWGFGNPFIRQTTGWSDMTGDDDPVWVAWRLWRMGQLMEYLKAVTAAARAVKPDVLVTDNNTGRWVRPYPLMENGKFVRWLQPRELGLDFLSCDPVFFGGNHEVVLSRDGRYQATTGVPFDYMNERFHKWGEWQLRSTTDFKLEFATKLAVGATCFFADQPYHDGTLEPDVYARLGEGYDFVRVREPFVQGAALTPDVAILASGASQIFGPLGNGINAGRVTNGQVGSGNAGARTDRVEGAHLALIEQGIQCLIYDEPTLREQLSAQSAVLIAEQPLLEDATIDALHEYVENGGTMIVTGRSGRWDEQYRPRSHTRLYDLLGVRVEGDHAAPIHYFRLSDAFRTGTALPTVPVQMWGTAVSVSLESDVEVLAELLPPLEQVWRDGVQDEAHWQHHTVFGAPPPGKTPIGAGITLRRVGKGRTIFVAVDPFASYRHEGHYLARLLLTRLMDIALPRRERRISADKPLHVEVSLQHQDSRQIVHLLNYFVQKRTAQMVHNDELTPVDGIVIHVRADAPPRRVSAQPDNHALEWHYADGVVTVRAPQLHIHSMIVIE
jgi:hypothetical protein